MRIFFITPKINFQNIGGSLIEYDLMIRTLMRLGHQVTVVTAFSDLNAGTDNLPYKIIEENVNRPRRLLKIQKNIFQILRKYSDQADFFHIDGQVFLYGAGLYRRLGGRVPVSAYFNRELVCWPDGEANFIFQNSNIFIKIKKTLRFYIEKYIGTPAANGIDLMLFTNPYLRKSYEKELGGYKADKVKTITNLPENILTDEQKCEKVGGKVFMNNDIKSCKLPTNPDGSSHVIFPIGMIDKYI